MSFIYKYIHIIFLNQNIYTIIRNILYSSTLSTIVMSLNMNNITNFTSNPKTLFT